MAQFAWAYVDCRPDAKAHGPTGSVQFVTGAGNSSGSLNFMFHTAAVYGYAANTLTLTGTVVISGAISASSYHIKDITEIHGSGSTYFGDDQTDMHSRTGSFELYSNTAKIFKIQNNGAVVSGSGIF